MNKKLLIGLSSIGIAAGFWACGEGSIEPMDEGTDVYVDAMLGTLDFNTQVDDAMKKCNEDIVCMNEMAKAAHSAIELSSESVDPLSSDGGASMPVTSSSSESFFKFSSIGDVGMLSSSSDAGPVVVSSSSEQIIITGIGRCYPISETIEQNGTAQWKVEWNSSYSIRDVAAASYSWTFGMDATPDNVNAASPKVSYSKSGAKSASVDVTIGGNKGHLDCDKTVNVNGAPITGCMCTTPATSVDFTESPDVVWTVSGCKAQGQTTFFYSWEGGEAGAATTFTKTFAAAQNGYAPKLKVSHADNTIIDVTCPAVKTTAGPEYLFEIEGDQLNTTAKAIKNEGCMVVRGEWTNSGYQPTFSVLCDGKADDQNVGMTFTMTYAGKSVATATGTWGFSNAGAKIGQINVGKFNYEGICVTFTGASTVTCKVQ